MFEVDPFWPKSVPNNWLLGWTIGVWVDEQDHVWIIHRGAGALHNNEKGAELSPPIAECCRTRRRCSRSTRTAIWCDRGAVPVRVMNGRNPIMASTSTTRATSGSAATARRMRTSSSSPRTASSCCRSAARQERRQQQPREFRACRQDLGRSEDERGLHRGRLHQQARGGDRRRYRQDEAVLGRLRQQARRHQPRPYDPEGAARTTIPQSRALRRAFERRAGLCLRPRQQSTAGIPTGRHFREGSVLRQEHLRRRVGLGHRRSPRIPEQRFIFWRTARTTGCASSCARRSRR